MFDNISIQSMMISFSNPGGRHFPKMTHLTTYLFFRSVSLRAKVPIPSNLPAASTTFLFLNKCSCSHTFWQRVLCNVNGNAFQPETYLNWWIGSARGTTKTCERGVVEHWKEQRSPSDGNFGLKHRIVKHLAWLKRLTVVRAWAFAKSWPGIPDPSRSSRRSQDES